MTPIHLTFPQLNATLGAVIVAREQASASIARQYALGAETVDTAHLEQLQGAEKALRDAMRVPARTGLPAFPGPIGEVARYEADVREARIERVLAASEDDNPTPFPIPNDDLRDDPEAIQSGNGR
jgi:hypothetical protein